MATDSKLEVVPMCSLCGNLMDRLQRTTETLFLPVFACGVGAKQKSPCDGLAALYGSRI